MKFGDRFKVLINDFKPMYEKLGYNNDPEYLLLVDDNGKLYYKIIDDRDNSISSHNTSDSFYSKILRAKALFILSDLLNNEVIQAIEED